MTDKRFILLRLPIDLLFSVRASKKQQILEGCLSLRLQEPCIVGANTKREGSLKSQARAYRFRKKKK